MSETNSEIRYDAWLRRNPPHPGSHIYHGCLEAVDGVGGMGVGAAARKLGVSRVALSRVLNGHAGDLSTTGAEAGGCRVGLGGFVDEPSGQL